jgi:hypothetical protein
MKKDKVKKEPKMKRNKIPKNVPPLADELEDMFIERIQALVKELTTGSEENREEAGEEFAAMCAAGGLTNRAGKLIPEVSELF